MSPILLNNPKIKQLKITRIGQKINGTYPNCSKWFHRPLYYDVRLKSRRKLRPFPGECRKREEIPSVPLSRFTALQSCQPAKSRLPFSLSKQKTMTKIFSNRPVPIFFNVLCQIFIADLLPFLCKSQKSDIEKKIYLCSLKDFTV